MQTTTEWTLMSQMHNNGILFSTYFTDYPQGPQNLTTLTPPLDVQTGTSNFDSFW